MACMSEDSLHSTEIARRESPVVKIIQRQVCMQIVSPETLVDVPAVMC